MYDIFFHIFCRRAKNNIANILHSFFFKNTYSKIYSVRLFLYFERQHFLVDNILFMIEINIKKLQLFKIILTQIYFWAYHFPFFKVINMKKGSFHCVLINIL